ncbi:ABC-type phosphate/phosphonate transport system ATPase subunit [Variovorax sp. TBS-050B]|nr:ABC-type phosphate/phosphonate transport system ATPase subunit [Variovorax sp. TBS-050B]
MGVARVLYQRPALLLADEPVSALDPTLADTTVRELVAQSEATGATLVASLHAVDLALRWFPRVVGMRAGRVVFDVPAGAVDAAMLDALYAGEGGLAAASAAAQPPAVRPLQEAAFVPPDCP